MENIFLKNIYIDLLFIYLARCSELWHTGSSSRASCTGGVFPERPQGKSQKKHISYFLCYFGFGLGPEDPRETKNSSEKLWNVSSWPAEGALSNTDCPPRPPAPPPSQWIHVAADPGDAWPGCTSAGRGSLGKALSSLHPVLLAAAPSYPAPCDRSSPSSVPSPLW